MCILFFFFCVLSGSVIPMIEAVKKVVPIEKLAVHFHDTYGQALSNILVSLQVKIISSLTETLKFYILNRCF